MNLGKTIRLFIDTEFTDFVKRDLISIGAATENGETFYGENLDFVQAWSSEWVKTNVYPLLKPNEFGKSRKELAAAFWEWIDELSCTNVIISYDYDGDMDLLLELFGDELPAKVIGYQNINKLMHYACDNQVQAMGGTDTDYQNLVRKVKANFELEFMTYFMQTKETQHHALSDAKANLRAWNFVVTNFGMPL